MISDCCLFVPVDIYKLYPTGHFLLPEEKLVDYHVKVSFQLSTCIDWNQGVTWLKLRKKRLAIRVDFPELDNTQKNFVINPFWTAKEVYDYLIRFDIFFNSFSS